MGRGGRRARSRRRRRSRRWARRRRVPPRARRRRTGVRPLALSPTTASAESTPAARGRRGRLHRGRPRPPPAQWRPRSARLRSGRRRARTGRRTSTRIRRRRRGEPARRPGPDVDEPAARGEPSGDRHRSPPAIASPRPCDRCRHAFVGLVHQADELGGARRSRSARLRVRPSVASSSKARLFCCSAPVTWPVYAPTVEWSRPICRLRAALVLICPEDDYAKGPVSAWRRSRSTTSRRSTATTSSR